MITGFNTDIEFEGVTYHVQTEDKGLAKPVIMSLVYDGGTILASRRVSYEDLIESGFDEKILEGRLNRQHSLICAAIKAGRLEDLKALSKGEGVAAQNAAVKMSETVAAGESAFPETYDAVPKPESGELSTPIPRPVFDGNDDLEALMSFSEPLVDVIHVIEEEEVFVLPDTAVEIVSDMAGKARPGNDRLSIELLGETDFKGGDRKSVGFMVCRGTERKVVPYAQVMVKIIGSTFRPLIFHAATDQNGIAKVNLQLPGFRSGRAAFLVRAMSEGEEVELRRPITHG